MLHVSSTQVGAFYYGYQEQAVGNIPGLTDALRQRPSAVVLIIGPYARGSPMLMQVIDYVRQLNREDDSIEFLVIAYEDAEQVIAHVNRPTCLKVPKKPSPSNKFDGHWHTMLCQEFAGALKEIEENQSPEPNVGLGGLLLDESGRFFLARRRAGIGRDRYVTFGGELLRGMSVKEALGYYAHEQLKLPRDTFEFGPLLACTNMRRGRNHYVDLTFLVLAGSAKVGVDAGRHEPINQRSVITDPESYWWDFKNMARYHRSGKLFRPVANAFERYCMLAAYNMLRGVLPQHDSHVSETVAAGPALPPLPSVSADDLIHFVTRIAWSERSPYFFESEI
jgi:hypothetical protein